MSSPSCEDLLSSTHGKIDSVPASISCCRIDVAALNGAQQMNEPDTVKAQTGHKMEMDTLS